VERKKGEDEGGNSFTCIERGTNCLGGCRSRESGRPPSKGGHLKIREGVREKCKDRPSR